MTGKAQRKSPVGGQGRKSEIRMSKSETKPLFGAFPPCIIRACFEFRASRFLGTGRKKKPRAEARGDYLHKEQ